MALKVKKRKSRTQPDVTDDNFADEQEEEEQEGTRNGPPYVCPVCKMQIATERGLKIHLTRMHGNGGESKPVATQPKATSKPKPVSTQPQPQPNRLRHCPGCGDMLGRLLNAPGVRFCGACGFDLRRFLR